MKQKTLDAIKSNIETDGLINTSEQFGLSVNKLIELCDLHYKTFEDIDFQPNWAGISGTAYFTPLGGSWSGTSLDYNYLFSGDTTCEIYQSEDNPFLDGPLVISGYTGKIMFENGYGASVIRNEQSYGGHIGLYELAVLDNYGKLTYDTPITDDVLGYLNPKEVTNYLIQIQDLK